MVAVLLTKTLNPFWCIYECQIFGNFEGPATTFNKVHNKNWGHP